MHWILLHMPVFMRDTVCITLTVAALHYLEVKAADVLNFCVILPNCEKIWTVLGPEFGIMLVSQL